MQYTETTNVHPRLQIKDHEQRSPFGLVFFAADEPKGDLAQGENGLNSPNTDLHMRSYLMRHMRSYADNRQNPPFRK